MTCAACATRIERKLNKLDGVDATVNYATERATVAFAPAVAPSDLVAAVEAAGYRALLPGEEARPDTSSAGRRLTVSAALTVPLVLLSMIPPLQFEGWEWVAFALATPIVAWGGWPFHRAALMNARHGAATMDTLISIGTVAAFAWSAVVLVAGVDADMYFEVAGVITTLILLGRFLEARARRRSGEAIRALLQLGAKEARVAARRDRGRRPGGRARGRRPFRRAAGRADRDRRGRRGRRVRDRPVVADRRVAPGRGRTGRRGRGRHDQLIRPARRPGDQGRSRDRGRADRAPRRRGAGGAGPDPAARRPRLCSLRPGRARAVAGHARGMAGAHRRCVRSLHRGRRGLDHRVPVRSRPRDADGADGRHRPRRAARDPDQRPGDPREHAPRDDDRARQDRHGDRGEAQAHGASCC